jgi:hypothetical protein
MRLMKRTLVLSLGCFMSQRLKPAQLLHCRAPPFTVAARDLETGQIPRFPHLPNTSYMDPISQLNLGYELLFSFA